MIHSKKDKVSRPTIIPFYSYCFYRTYSLYERLEQSGIGGTTVFFYWIFFTIHSIENIILILLGIRITETYALIRAIIVIVLVGFLEYKISFDSIFKKLKRHYSQDGYRKLKGWLVLFYYILIFLSFCVTTYLAA